MLWSTSEIRQSVAARDIAQANQVLRSLAHALRLRIVAVVDVNDDLSISQIADILKVSQPLVTYHVKILVKAEILELIPCGKMHCPRFTSMHMQQLVRSLLRPKKGGDRHGQYDE